MLQSSWGLIRWVEMGERGAMIFPPVPFPRPHGLRFRTPTQHGKTSATSTSAHSFRTQPVAALVQGKISARLVGSLLEDRTSRRNVGARHVGLLHEQGWSELSCDAGHVHFLGAALHTHTSSLLTHSPSLPQRVRAPVGSSLNLRSRVSEADVSKRGALVEKALLQQLDALGVLKKSDQPAGTGERAGDSSEGASEQASARARRAVKREDATDSSEDTSGAAAQGSSAGPADEVLQELQVVSKALEQEDAFILGILTRLRRVAQPAALRREVSAREEERHRDELDVEMLQLYHQRLAYAQLHEVCTGRGGGFKLASA